MTMNNTIKNGPRDNAIKRLDYQLVVVRGYKRNRVYKKVMRPFYSIGYDKYYKLVKKSTELAPMNEAEREASESLYNGGLEHSNKFLRRIDLK